MNCWGAPGSSWGLPGAVDVSGAVREIREAFPGWGGGDSRHMTCIGRDWAGVGRSGQFSNLGGLSEEEGEETSVAEH